MSGQKVVIDIDNAFDADNEVELRSCGSVFSGRIDLLASRADILNSKDRALMKMYLKHGMTFRQMAQVAGTYESMISRRIHKLTSRLIEGEYITCLQNRDKFDRIEMAVARDYFLEGISQQAIAKKRGLTVYTTRKILLKIQDIVSKLA
jgi:hypothetical protein